MKAKKMLICDSDAAYSKALGLYLMRSLEEFQVVMYSDPGMFLADEEEYELALLGKEFILQVNDMSPVEKKRFGKILFLSSQVGEAGFEAYESVFKFQDMNSFVNAIFSFAGIEPVQTRTVVGDGRWIGIYSPIHHELQLPFALAYAKLLSASCRVLFVDMEANSIMKSLIECEEEHNLLDVLYLLEEEKTDITEWVYPYDGLDILLPMANFGELTSVLEKDWDSFFSAVATAGYERMIVLFDEGIRCAGKLIELSEELILLSRPGDYYRKSEGRIRHFLEEMEKPPTVREVNLAMSGSNLSDGTYRFEQLLQGNLGRFVAETFEL